MTDLDAPPAQETAPRRVRWWFPAMFAGSVAAVAIAVAVINLGGDPAPPPPIERGVVDLGNQLGADAPQQNERAPDFVVTALDGSTFRLSEHLASDGRPVFLNLWASWCFPCRAEMPAIDAAAAAHPEVLFLGVAVQDTEDAARAFAEEIGVTYTLGVDDGSVGEAYPALGLPATYLIDSDGTIVERHFGQVTEDSIAEKLALLGS